MVVGKKAKIHISRLHTHNVRIAFLPEHAGNAKHSATSCHYHSAPYTKNSSTAAHTIHQNLARERYKWQEQQVQAEWPRQSGAVLDERDAVQKHSHVLSLYYIPFGFLFPFICYYCNLGQQICFHNKHRKGVDEGFCSLLCSSGFRFCFGFLLE